MAKLYKIKPGQLLYDVHSVRAGNTTMRRQGIWTVKVIEIHAAEGWALCSWNGNPPKRYTAREIERLRVSEPKKLNGHVRTCPRSSSLLSWGESCTCPKTGESGAR